MVSNPNKVLSTFLRSDIHATDSTFKGWNANMAATKALFQIAPVMRNRTKNSNKELTI